MSDPISADTAAAPKGLGVIGQIRDQLNQVLGGNNPNQYFMMTVPGTILDPSEYAYDVTKAKPVVVAANESRLVDQLFDVTTVSPAPNGQRLSSQFLQALSVLVPKFDPMMPRIKNKLRAYLHSPAPASATVSGEPFVGNLEEFYFALYEAWLAEKSKWETEVIEQREKSTPEVFLEWYEEVAETRLAIVDAAEGRLLAVFSPADMNAILGALAAGPGGAIQEASQQVMDLRVPSPDGGFIYPVNLTPDNWFLDLASDQDPVDLLQDPAFIALTLTARRQALSASVSQVQNLVAQMPSNADLAGAARAFSTAQTAYATAQSNLQTAYTANTITAANMAARYEASTSGVGKLDADVAEVSKAAKDTDDAVHDKAAKADGTGLSPKDMAALTAGMKAVSDAQTALLAGAQGLVSAGLTLGSDQAATFADAPVLLSRLQQQLADITTLQNQLATPRPPVTTPPVTAVVTGDSPATISKILAAADGPSVDPQAYLASVGEALPSNVTPDASAAANTVKPDDTTKPAAADVDPPLTFAAVLAAGYSAWGSALNDAVSLADDDLTTWIASVQEALDTASAAADATPETVKTAIGTAVNTPPSGMADIGTSISTAADSTAATEVATLAQLIETQLAAIVARANNWVDESATKLAPLQAGTAAPADVNLLASFTTAPAPAATTNVAGVDSYVEGVLSGLKGSDIVPRVRTAVEARASSFVAAPSTTGAMTPAVTSDRWLSLQYSVSTDDATDISSAASSSSETSWSVDLFLGSASGSSSSSSASDSKSQLDSSVSVDIGMKVTKVEIERGWFDPGVFKLSGDMSRISSLPISFGTVDATDEAVAGTANKAILPAFPVAFVVAKDVTIRFQAHSEALADIQTVLDSKSAVGGGFLCFSASSASAAHSDASSLHTKVTDTVVNISMPGPQILGWFNEFTPHDKSVIMGQADPNSTTADQLDIVDFVDQLQTFAGTADPAAPSTFAS
ncbi:hypothetical protein [Curtobacterium sp. 8I-2]|uniref:hypothetical protein n=1 Tax=Curtobacterium sp. 8I-2 TaxID=2653136 RepID=UPI0012F0F769|nr:hypothetical protein [Curtobacterium sp. 8I-2]VXC06217.1 conserved hypothetical protein [Curtobacterium sp. 8I-2]